MIRATFRAVGPVAKGAPVVLVGDSAVRAGRPGDRPMGTIVGPVSPAGYVDVVLTMPGLFLAIDGIEGSTWTPPAEPPRPAVDECRSCGCPFPENPCRYCGSQTRRPR